jgi:uncharacterized protein
MLVWVCIEKRYNIESLKNKYFMKLPKFLFFVVYSLIFVFRIHGQSTDIDILFQQKIPVRDGINLSANIYKPALMVEPLPVILMITPYVSYFNPEYGPYYAENGYVFVYVDTRGRGNSEGEFAPFERDGKDGYDVVEWLAKQPWCNGKVGMMGSSYRGMVQWFTLKEFPQSLHSIAPTASVAPGIDFQYNNIFSTYSVQWLALVQGKTNNIKIFESDYWGAKNKKAFKEYLPFSKLDSFTGIDRKIFQKWISHPAYDDYWENMVPTKDEFAKMNIPVLTVTGYFDGGQPGALFYYHNHLKYASDKAKNNHYIVIGPWSHFGTIFPTSKLGGLSFGENAVIDVKKMHLDWFNWTLKNHEKPEFLKKNASFYIMGDNRWHYAASLEKISDKWATYYLSSTNGKAHSVFQSGELVPLIQEQQIPDTIVYDPLDITYADYKTSSNFYTDQSSVFRKGNLIYHTNPFTEDITVAGKIRVNLYLQINTPDCDIQYTIYEIKPNGESVYLTEDLMRARYRESNKYEKLINSEDINLYEFNSQYFFVRKISKGSMLRFVFSTLNSPNYQKNYNSGGDVSFETCKDAKTATIKLFHNQEFPSSIMLPILKENTY